MQKTSIVARFSAAFIKNYRVTTLLFLSILGLGFLSYTTLLKVEGFPAVQVPVVFVEGEYFVNDADQVNRELTTPLEQAAAELSDVTQVSSTTTPVGTFVVAQFTETVSSEDGVDLLKDSIERTVALPQGASIKYRTINAAAIDGEHDLIFNISGSDSIGELQIAADEIAIEVTKHADVAVAETLSLVENQVNPITGESFERQARFNRVGYRAEDGSLIFERAVSVGVIQKPGVGSVDLSKAVKSQVENYQNSGELKDFTVTYGGDFSRGALDQKNSLEKNALIGLISVILLIFLLIDWRASIVGGIFIPLVFAGVFLALYAIGYTLNVVSLFALVLVLGIFVDNATVVIDAIERAKDRGLKGVDAIKDAIGEVGTSVIAGTWTTILVFIPMAFISGVLGDFIILIPVTVIIALLISLFLALAVTPWLGNLFIRDRKSDVPEKRSLLNISSRSVGWLSKHIGRFINTYLAKKWKVAVVMVIALVLIGFGGSYAGKLNFAVFPAAKDGEQIMANIEFNTGTSIKDAETSASEIETIFKNELGDELVAITYFSASDTAAMIMMDLTDIDARETTLLEFVDQLNAAVENYEPAAVTIVSSGVGPPTDDYQLTVRVLADSIDLLEKGTSDVKDFLVDRELDDGEKITEVKVDRVDVLTKIDGSRTAAVRAKISDPEKTDVILGLQEDIEAEYSAQRVKELGLKEGAITPDLGQEGENVESFESAAIALMVALIVMYALLVAQFNSFVQPLLIFLAIPFAFPVLFPALYATNNSLSFFVMLGIIALSGVVVNNTIILVHQANLLRKKGESARDAISKAISIRFRALIATSLTTIAGLLPLALSDPFWEPLAYSIIFGLASSVVLAIFAFPAFYVFVEGLRDWSSRLVRRDKRA